MSKVSTLFRELGIRKFANLTKQRNLCTLLAEPSGKKSEIENSFKTMFLPTGNEAADCIGRYRSAIALSLASNGNSLILNRDHGLAKQ